MTNVARFIVIVMTNMLAAGTVFADSKPVCQIEILHQEKDMRERFQYQKHFELLKKISASISKADGIKLEKFVYMSEITEAQQRTLNAVIVKALKKNGFTEGDPSALLKNNQYLEERIFADEPTGPIIFRVADGVSARMHFDTHRGLALVLEMSNPERRTANSITAVLWTVPGLVVAGGEPDCEKALVLE